jgi:hypothetical protein
MGQKETKWNLFGMGQALPSPAAPEKQAGFGVFIPYNTRNYGISDQFDKYFPFRPVLGTVLA